MYKIVFAIALLSVGVQAEEQKGKAVELTPSKVYLPAKGFDDNDRIEAVIEGELPNPCYTLTDTLVEKSKDKKSFLVRQMAWRRLTGACDTDDLVDDPIPFTTVAPLGRLDSADYSVTYRKRGGEVGERKFQVDEAKSEQIDNYFYAVVTQIDAEDFYPEGKEITLALKGFIPSTCLELERPIKTEIQDDLILVMPTLMTNPEDCKKAKQPFSDSLTLKPLKAGNYLLHVRTRGGSALYRPITVYKKGR